MSEVIEVLEMGDRLTREDVDRCAQPAQLAAWFTDRSEAAAELKIWIDAFRESGGREADWFRRAGGKLAYLRIEAHWIERRMLRLGAEPRDPRQRKIHALERNCEVYKKALRKAGLPIPDGAIDG